MLYFQICIFLSYLCCVFASPVRRRRNEDGSLEKRQPRKREYVHTITLLPHNYDYYKKLYQAKPSFEVATIQNDPKISYEVNPVHFNTEPHHEVPILHEPKISYEVNPVHFNNEPHFEVPEVPTLHEPKISYEVKNNFHTEPHFEVPTNNDPKLNYEVNDPHTGDYKTHWEERNGDNVKGEYSVFDADGSLRIVKYSADEKNGFVAEVERIIGVPQHDKAEYSLKTINKD